MKINISKKIQKIFDDVITTKNDQFWSNLLEFNIFDSICIEKVQKYYAYGILKATIKNSKKN